MIPGALGALSGPAMQGIVTAQTARTQQGELQGGIASMMSLAAILSPPLMTQTFGYFSSDAAPLYFPGAAFTLAALFTVGSLILFVRISGEDRTRAGFRRSGVTAAGVCATSFVLIRGRSLGVAPGLSDCRMAANAEPGSGWCRRRKRTYLLPPFTASQAGSLYQLHFDWRRGSCRFEDLLPHRSRWQRWPAQLSPKPAPPTSTAPHAGLEEVSRHRPRLRGADEDGPAGEQSSSASPSTRAPRQRLEELHLAPCRYLNFAGGTGGARLFRIRGIIGERREFVDPIDCIGRRHRCAVDFCAAPALPPRYLDVEPGRGPCVDRGRVMGRMRSPAS
ncbi:MAG: hypothetical protein U5O39_06175 [Gammaproteobacteria bacterium]|nr:hypothetical protein [Gammaproteobacteria bacterium]